MNPITITTRRNHGPALTKAQRAAFVALPICILLWIAIGVSRIRASPSFAGGAGCLVSHGTYSGSIYAKPHETLGDTCLVESPWMRLAQHSVRLPPSGEEGDDGNGRVVDDWLWIDYHDRINVLVEAPPRPVTDDAAAASTENGASTREETSFIVISQTKYALPNDASLAVVGGIIEPGEEVLTAAQREVREELKVTCRNWKVLGNKFRTDVNRGMGWVSRDHWAAEPAKEPNFLPQQSVALVAPSPFALHLLTMIHHNSDYFLAGASVFSQGLLLFLRRKYQR